MDNLFQKYQKLVMSAGFRKVMNANPNPSIIESLLISEGVDPWIAFGKPISERDVRLGFPSVGIDILDETKAPLPGVGSIKAIPSQVLGVLFEPSSQTKEILEKGGSTPDYTTGASRPVSPDDLRAIAGKVELYSKRIEVHSSFFYGDGNQFLSSSIKRSDAVRITLKGDVNFLRKIYGLPLVQGVPIPINNDEVVVDPLGFVRSATLGAAIHLAVLGLQTDKECHLSFDAIGETTNDYLAEWLIAYITKTHSFDSRFRLPIMLYTIMQEAGDTGRSPGYEGLLAHSKAVNPTSNTRGYIQFTEKSFVMMMDLAGKRKIEAPYHLDFSVARVISPVWALVAQKGFGHGHFFSGLAALIMSFDWVVVWMRDILARSTFSAPPFNNLSIRYAVYTPGYVGLLVGQRADWFNSAFYHAAGLRGSKGIPVKKVAEVWGLQMAKEEDIVTQDTMIAQPSRGGSPKVRLLAAALGARFTVLSRTNNTVYQTYPKKRDLKGDFRRESSVSIALPVDLNLRVIEFVSRSLYTQSSSGTSFKKNMITSDDMADTKVTDLNELKKFRDMDVAENAAGFAFLSSLSEANRKVANTDIINVVSDMNAAIVGDSGSLIAEYDYVKLTQSDDLDFGVGLDIFSESKIK